MLRTIDEPIQRGSSATGDDAFALFRIPTARTSEILNPRRTLVASGPGKWVRDLDREIV